MKPKASVLPEYDKAVTSLSLKLLQELAWTTAPILGKIQKVPATELPQASAPPEAAQGAFAPIAMQAEFRESINDVLTTDIDSWIAMIAEQGDKVGESIEKEFFKFVDKVTTEAGQVVDAQGRPFSHDLVLDMLEKLQIEFDADGNPQMPTIVVHPNALKSLGEPTPEQLKRRAEIIERKRREFLARRRVRKLD